MVEKLIDNMDENYETTKNESRPSEIAKLQKMLLEIYPSLIKHFDSFFASKDYFPKDENINIIPFEELKQVLNSQKEIAREQNQGSIQKAA